MIKTAQWIAGPISLEIYFTNFSVYENCEIVSPIDLIMTYNSPIKRHCDSQIA